ncbi:unnamed protein product [Vitrella brassicaformis CCMP3155]|uniref:Major facilitator superfamily (MFS) profile domain-containing protein n=2 Tax=Vitrella brassicaformis TaxID=1169539 RepID=A0A0G4EA52_VITBC|nr:unnamed protein product [Vitrella brassicaformis CCMP3155]|eukprot:CEL92827.1 unnamed protein product [Vitrella brassicaformis CCMP3155]
MVPSTPSAPQPGILLAHLAVEVAIVSSAVTLPTIFLPHYIRNKFRVSEYQAVGALLLSTYPLCEFLVAPLVVTFAKACGRLPLLYVGAFLHAIATLLYGVMDYMVPDDDPRQLVYYFLLVFCMAVGATMAITMFTAETIDAFSKRATNQAMGVRQAALSAGALLGMPLGGLLYDIGGFMGPYLFVCSFSLVSALLLPFTVGLPSSSKQFPDSPLPRPFESRVIFRTPCTTRQKNGDEDPRQIKSDGEEPDGFAKWYGYSPGEGDTDAVMEVATEHTPILRSRGSPRADEDSCTPASGSEDERTRNSTGRACRAASTVTVSSSALWALSTLNDPCVIVGCLTALMNGFAMSFYCPIIGEPLFQSLQTSSHLNVGSLTCIIVFARLVSSWPVGALADRIGGLPVLTSGYIVTGIAYGSFACWRQGIQWAGHPTAVGLPSTTRKLVMISVSVLSLGALGVGLSLIATPCPVVIRDFLLREGLRQTEASMLTASYEWGMVALGASARLREAV